MYADEEDDDNMGPTWPMEDIHSGPLFTETYQIVAASALPSASLRTSVEHGNKSMHSSHQWFHQLLVVMPASALDTLSRLNIVYPMMFQVHGERTGLSTHCGVLEFSAPEGVVYLPSWMTKGLKIGAGDLVTMTNVALPVGSFIKIQPQSVDFLDITDPRAVLEHSLRNFATLTAGDCVAISYNGRVYELLVLEVRPQNGSGGISVLETDLQVDFAPPLGYQEPSYSPKAPLEKSIVAITDHGSHQRSSQSSTFAPFRGAGQRLSNRSRLGSATADPEVPDATEQASTGPMPLALPKGTMFFASSRKTTPTPTPTPTSTPSTTSTPDLEAIPKSLRKSTENSFTAFSGQPRKLQ